MHVFFNTVPPYLRGSAEGNGTASVSDAWVLVRDRFEHSASGALRVLESVSSPTVSSTPTPSSRPLSSDGNNGMWVVGVFVSAACVFVGVCMYLHSAAGERRIQALLGMRRYLIPPPGTETVLVEHDPMQGTPTSVSSASLPPSPHAEF